MRHLLPGLLPNYQLILAVMLLFNTGVASAEPEDVREAMSNHRSNKISAPASWAIAFDNDTLVPGNRDQDYTYGINLTIAGRQAENNWASAHRPLDWINNLIGLDGYIGSGIKASKIEFGLFGFTPEEISVATAQPNDRPYASLIYASSARENYDNLREISWQTTLTLGILGLSLVGDVQGSVHSILGAADPKGWDNQISDGGELTARYNVSRQSLLYQSGSGLEVKSTIQGSVGYITEFSWSLSTRAGEIHTPWVSFNPELVTYGEQSNPNARVKVSEQYAWAGIAFKLRAYNAFLQGQFRDSVVSYDSDEINHAIVEAWVGYTIGFDDGYSITYSIRGHSSELKQGIADRNVVWGGLLVSKTFL